MILMIYKQPMRLLQGLKNLRRGGELLFAAQILFDGSEVDITNQVRREING